MSLKRRFYQLSLLLFQFIWISGYPVEDGNTGTFWQITDVHWDKQYSVSGDPNEMCHLSINTTQDFLSGDYGNFNCDSPWKLINSSIEAMFKYKSDPDFIIWTGDNAPHVWNPAPNFKDITSILANVTKLLALKFPNSTILPVIGNHDTFPPDTVPENSNISYYNQYLTAGRWNEVLPNNTWDTFLHGGYYSFSASSNLIILGLNTILWYKSNPLTRNSTDPADQFEWLEKELANAKNEKNKVFIIGHISPGHSNRGLYTQINPSLYQTRFNERYITIITKYGDIISGQFFAHLHADVFGLFRNAEKVASSMLLSPSITPWHSNTPDMKGISVSPNPSIRLYYFNRQDGKILDYKQYFLNLTKANEDFNSKKNAEDNSTSQEDLINWELFYTFTKAYNVSDVSTESLESLLKDLAKNPDTFEKYYSFTTVGKDNGLCNQTCKQMHLCSIAFQSHSSYTDCMKMHEPQTSTDRGATPTARSPETKSHEAQKQANSSSRNILIGCTLSLLVLIMIMVVVYIKRSRLARGPRFVRFQ